MLRRCVNGRNVVHVSAITTHVDVEHERYLTVGRRSQQLDRVFATWIRDLSHEQHIALVVRACAQRWKTVMSGHERAGARARRV
jgi:hypothetical protein